MGILICIVYLISVVAAHEHTAPKYQNQLGYCEPLTVEFIAGLVAKEARQLLDPGSRPQHKQLRYDLYTRRNPDKRQLLLTGERERLQRSHFNSSWPVRFTIHGWNGQTTTCSNAAIKDAYLSKGDYNVILVDWSDYALDINYVRVVAEITEIAAQFNEFAHFLHNSTGIAYSALYLIGHSAGCHIAGVAGKLLQPHKYGVIYALEPSGPIHQLLSARMRLAPTDAHYVESIQTDVALFGFPSANLAHASFFPNWGLGQRHCPNVTTMEPDFTCDHFGALYYFVESLQNASAFGAIKCASFQSVQKFKCGCGKRICAAETYMGGDPAQPKQGVYYLSTRAKRPFGYGDICRMKKPMKPTIVRLP